MAEFIDGSCLEGFLNKIAIDGGLFDVHSAAYFGVGDFLLVYLAFDEVAHVWEGFEIVFHGVLFCLLD